MGISKRFRVATPFFILFVGLLLTLLTPLLFAPVPWPDDSAYWIAGRDFWSAFPPKLIMRPLAAFVPSYAEASFNTMPLLPILVGLGEFLGIQGTFGIKFWPLLGWTLSGVALVFFLRTRLVGKPSLLLGLSLLVAFHPVLRWSSLLVRPEPWIGAIGTVLVLGLSLRASFFFPEQRKWGDPIAILLALAAYFHFNAIHLVPVVCVALVLSAPRRLLRIAGETFVYLCPWFVWVLLHWDSFRAQMEIQFHRLSFINPWLDTLEGWRTGLFQNMGVPVPYSEVLYWASWPLWGVVGITLGGVAFGVSTRVLIALRAGPEKKTPKVGDVDLLPAGTWLLSALLLWHFKAEVWFTHYLHLALVCLLGLTWVWAQDPFRQNSVVGLVRVSSTVLIWSLGLVFLGVSGKLAFDLSKQKSWTSDNYKAWVDCVRQRLEKVDSLRASRTLPFSVWAPTFPEVLVELSMAHPDWELTRTNDFSPAISRALEFGKKVDTLVITENYSSIPQWREGPLEEFPEAQSVWLNWKGYYYSNLNQIPGFKPRRYLCQAGVLQAFILSN